MKTLKERPETIFLLFVVVHMVCWTLLPSLVNPNLPYDVIEGLAWGHEWQWGYYKHPPVKPWSLETMAILSGQGDWAMYFLSQICVATAFFAVWRLAKDFFNPKLALIAVLLLEGIYYHNYTSPEFNVNVAELPFWAMTIYFVWRGLSRKSVSAWAFAGVCIGLGFLSKYIFLFLVLPIVVMLFSVKSFRAELKSPGPWLGAVIALIIAAPHLHWLVENDFPTITYGMAMADPGERSVINHVFYPLRFIISQPLILIPSLIMLWTMRRRQGMPVEPVDKSPEKSAFLLFTTFGPPLLMVIISAIFGWKLRSMWATPLFLISGVTLVYFLQERLSKQNLRGFTKAFVVFFVLFLVVYFAETSLGPRFTKRAKRTHFPGKALAMIATEKWHARFDQPLEIVIGSYWNAGNIAYYAPHRASVFIDGDLKKSPWISFEQIHEKGAIIVGQNKADAYRFANKNIKTIIDEGPIKLAPEFDYDLPPKEFWLLIVPPENLQKSS